MLEQGTIDMAMRMANTELCRLDTDGSLDRTGIEDDATI
jgi:hypothetical protein